MAPPDLAWDALADVCGFGSEVTQTERGRANAALKELRAIYPNSTMYAIAVDIRARAEVYAQKFPGMELTPQALTGNWSRLDPNDVHRQPASVMDEPPPKNCETCGGLRMVVANIRSDGNDFAEEYAPCPDCHPNPMAAGFWRADGTRHNPPEPKQIRAAMIRLLEGEADV